MSFLAPVSLAFAGLLPVVLLFYFLRLRRREEPISSTFLWQRAIQDLRVNAPFQRLRRNLLLYLQLLLLALLVLALARPAFRARAGTGRRYIVLLDTSASMAATDVKPSRLEAAKREALRLVGDLSRDDEMMLMTFDIRPRVIVPYTSSKPRLRAAIGEIQQHETSTDFALVVEDLLPLTEGGQNVHVFILSDGAFEDVSARAPIEADLTYVRIGQSPANLGLTALEARRSLEDWNQPQVFARVENMGPEKATVRLDLFLEGELLDARVLSVPPGQESAAVFSDGRLTEGLVRVALSREDDLAVDNQAWLTLTAPRKARTLVVTPGNYFLAHDLRVDPVCDPVFVDPAAFDAQSLAGTLSTADFDLTIFDRHAPASLAPGAYLFIGAVPPLEGFRADGEVDEPVVLDWDAAHPVNDHVKYGHLFLSKALRLTGPADARVLVDGESGPLILAWSSSSHRLIVVGFDSLASRWPLRPSFPIFLANVIRYLGGVRMSGTAAGVRAGHPIVLSVPLSRQRVGVTRPDGRVEETDVREGRVTFADTKACGPYTFDLGEDGRKTVVVNLLDSRESNLAPRETLAWEKVTVTGGRKALKENREVWSALALGALAALMAEWYVYNRRGFL